MRTKTTAALVSALAVVGLLISLTGAWSGLASGPRDQVAGPGPAASRAAADPPDRSGRQTQRQEGSRTAALRDTLPKVNRTDATALRKATRQTRTPRPVGVSLGSVGIDATVLPVGVAEDGQMQLPDDPRVVGWYKFGTTPGAGTGATVLAGHLDAEGFGLGPLVRLRDVEVGDNLGVRSTSGRTRAYEVTRVRRFDRQGLPTGLFSRSGPERLHLITCGGAYDSNNGGYQENLVVTAVPIR